MRAFLLAGLMCVSMCGISHAQSPSRRVIYPPVYDGWGQKPGLSVSRDGSYSIDRLGGSHSYRYGVVPSRPIYHRRRYSSQGYWDASPWWAAGSVESNPWHPGNFPGLFGGY